MVTQYEQEVADSEVDPDPQEDQTEGEEEAEDSLPSVAAETPDGAAAAEGEPPLTRAEVERLLAEREEQIRKTAIAEARELERRERQAAEGRKAFEEQQRVQMRDAVQVSLVKRLGITDVDDDTVDEIITRVRGVQDTTVETRTVTAYDEAITAAAARAVGIDPGPISPEAARFYDKLTSYMERFLSHDKVREFVTKGEKEKWAADLPKLVEAQKRKEATAGKQPLNRPEGRAVDTRTDAEIMRDPNSTLEQVKAATARWEKSRAPAR